MNSRNKHQRLYIYQQQFRADGTGNAAPAQSPERCMLFEEISNIMRKTIPFLFLIAIAFAVSCASTNKQTDCKRFKTGRFELHSKVDNSISLIERNDSIQTETDSKSGSVVKARIKWTANCEYELTYFSQTSNSSDTIVPFVQSRPLKTIILQMGKDFYVFKASMEGTNVTLVDTLKIVK